MKTRARTIALIWAAVPLIGVSSAGSAASVRGGSARPTLALFQPADFLGRAVRIAAGYGVVTSLFRTAEHNRLVGGMPNSYHLLGRALDVQRRPGVTHRMVEAALRAGGLALVESLDEVDHSHFAFAGAVAPVVLPPVRLPVTLASARPAPSKPVGPHVVADDHGLLLIDIPAASAVSAAGGN